MENTAIVTQKKCRISVKEKSLNLDYDGIKKSLPVSAEVQTIISDGRMDNCVLIDLRDLPRLIESLMEIRLMEIQTNESSMLTGRANTDHGFLETESWRPVLGWEGIYEVSDFGRVKRVLSGKSELLLKPVKRDDTKTYMVSLDYHGFKKTASISHLVALAFLGLPPENYCRIAFKDFNKANAKLDNLKWVTPEECRGSITIATSRAFRFDKTSQEVEAARAVINAKRTEACAPKPALHI